MNNLSATIATILLDRNIKLDRDQLDQAERSIIARMKFDDAGRLLTPLIDLADDERNARPELFTKD